MTDGSYLVSYAEVRNTSKGLDSDNLPDNVLDQHLNSAQQEVEELLRTDFDVDTTPTFTDELFNTSNLMLGRSGHILYFTNFDKDIGIVQSITEVSYRSSEDDSWEVLTEGQNDDYVFDIDIDALKFNYGLSSDGNQNLKVSGTYGYKFDDTPKKYKELVKLIAAIKGVCYASGGSYNTVDSHTIGDVSVSKGQYASNIKQEYTNLTKQLDDLLKRTGLRNERSSSEII